MKAPASPLSVPIDDSALDALCRRWQVEELAVFGSVLGQGFRADSDVDVLVSFKPGARLSLFDLARLQAELVGLFGREVDLVTRKGLEGSRNPIRRQAILGSARTLYAA